MRSNRSHPPPVAQCERIAQRASARGYTICCACACCCPAGDSGSTDGATLDRCRARARWRRRRRDRGDRIRTDGERRRAQPFRQATRLFFSMSCRPSVGPAVLLAWRSPGARRERRTPRPVDLRGNLRGDMRRASIPLKGYYTLAAHICSHPATRAHGADPRTPAHTFGVVRFRRVFSGSNSSRKKN